MRHVPIAEFQDNAVALLAAAEAGEEIVITREGYDVLHLGLTHAARRARKAAALNNLHRIGQEVRAKYGPTSAAEIREWIEEGRR
ncbi:hypothetical protein [Sphingomonas sp.]|jgi:antitoxin (DNA-binding transcriptional repressor) of toxin-antitoxin stability system|uniref:hypothetical protein n=1 Tax=Sphingomonas sp. TaxID=28214 RepID=UPI002ED94278